MTSSNTKGKDLPHSVAAEKKLTRFFTKSNEKCETKPRVIADSGVLDSYKKIILI